jgi:DNA topoisomerase-1
VQDSAPASDLRYTTDSARGIRRQRCGRGFSYFAANGQRVRSAKKLERIRKLAIPPAWTDVWICPRKDGHIQATGRDAKGRKQYRYHPDYRAERDETKFHRMLEFSTLLPKLRHQVEQDLSLPGLPREKVLATVVRLLEKTLIRVGNEVYARKNRSYGLTTLRDRHVEVTGDEIRFRFRGKSGIVHSVAVNDHRLARIIQQCQSLPGQDLFQFLDDNGKRQDISSSDVNEYLHRITGREVSAKDFRTWAGTMRAATAFRDVGPTDSEKDANKNVVQVIDQVAENLGNTRDVCRKYYVHPSVIERYLQGEVIPATPPLTKPKSRRPSAMLRRDEYAVLKFLDLEEHSS